MVLEIYQQKRNFKSTSEPKGRKGRKGGNSFVIQKHAATRLPYKLRLKMNGVLKSWAVTRGSSLLMGEKRLAVHVEHCPLEYSDFEGTVPKGEYGGGTFIVWDRGTWQVDGEGAKKLATYLLQTIGTMQIWIGFIGWASFYHCGGGRDGLRKSIAANLWGVAMAYIALLLNTQLNPGLPGPLWPSIVVGITAAILVLGAKIDAFSVIPASVYGYAATAGYGLLSGASLTTLSLANPLICAAVSLVIGGLFGIVSEKFAGVLKGGSKAATKDLWHDQ